MERELLRQYISIKMEIDDIENRISKDKRKLDSMKSETIKVKGGAGGKKRFFIDGHGKEYNQRKTDLQVKILKRNRLKEKLENTRDTIEAYIMDIDDSETRRIISLRYIDGLTWQGVAKAMGEGWMADTCRIKHQRFLNKEKNSED